MCAKGIYFPSISFTTFPSSFFTFELNPSYTGSFDSHTGIGIAGQLFDSNFYFFTFFFDGRQTSPTPRKTEAAPKPLIHRFATALSYLLGSGWYVGRNQARDSSLSQLNGNNDDQIPGHTVTLVQYRYRTLP